MRVEGQFPREIIPAGPIVEPTKRCVKNPVDLSVKSLVIRLSALNSHLSTASFRLSRPETTHSPRGRDGRLFIFPGALNILRHEPIIGGHHHDSRQEIEPRGDAENHIETKILLEQAGQ
jgi:hypothetical protein